MRNPQVFPTGGWRRLRASLSRHTQCSADGVTEPCATDASLVPAKPWWPHSPSTTPLLVLWVGAALPSHTLWWRTFTSKMGLPTPPHSCTKGSAPLGTPKCNGVLLRAPCIQTMRCQHPGGVGPVDVGVWGSTATPMMRWGGQKKLLVPIWLGRDVVSPQVGGGANAHQTSLETPKPPGHKTQTFWPPLEPTRPLPAQHQP